MGKLSLIKQSRSDRIRAISNVKTLVLTKTTQEDLSPDQSTVFHKGNMLLTITQYSLFWPLFHIYEETAQQKNEAHCPWAWS